MVKKLHAAHAPGIATDMSTTMGALINKAQYDRTMEYIQAGRAQGATLVTGGSHPSGARLANGFFIEPTVFSDVHKDMRIASEEIFGPVLSVMRWKNEEELFEAVNGVDFGLSWSSLFGHADRLIRVFRRPAPLSAVRTWLVIDSPGWNAT